MKLRKGFTLVELLVSMAIFAMLGGTLVLLLRNAMRAWRTGESRRAVYEEADTILSALRDDLRAATCSERDLLGEAPTVRLLCDEDAQGRQRLALVRTIAREPQSPIASLAGTDLGADKDMDGVGDREAATGGRLRPTSGLLEVLWAMDPERDELLRATHAPAGGPESLFDPAIAGDPAALRRVARPIGTRVMHMELAFWTQATASWEGDRPLRREVPGLKSGPAALWDSTRAVLPAPPGATDDDFLFFRADSLARVEDDVFPERILVTLVIAEEGPQAAWTQLVEPMTPASTEARVRASRGFEERGGYIRIDREWMRYTVFDGTTLRVDGGAGGRGRRGSAPMAHAAGSEVVTGHAFSVVIEIPGAREDWGG